MTDDDGPTPAPSIETTVGMTLEPLVSVVMPVRNGVPFVDEAVDSVLAQTFEDLELVVVDDQSTDDTPSVLRAWQRRDERVQVVTRPHRSGIADALNAGVRRSRGGLLARLDADDRAAPDRIRQQVEQFSERPRLGLLGTGARYMDREGRVVGIEPGVTGSAAARGLQGGNVFFHPSVMMRRAAFELAGGYRRQMEPAEDLDLWLRIAEHFEVDNLQDPLIDYRLHVDQSTLSDPSTQALAATAAHWAADVRATGAADPVEGLERVDEEFLLERGVARAVLVRGQVAAQRWTAELCEMAGYERPAEVAWRAARAQAASLGRAEEGRLLLLRARLRREQGKPFAHWADQARALARAPELVTHSLVRRLRGGGTV